MKAFFKKVHVLLGKGLSFVNIPLWALYDVLGGFGLGGFTYVVLGHYLGHGAATPTLVNGVYAMVIPAASFAAWALPVAFVLGIGLATMLIYLDIKYREDGES